MMVDAAARVVEHSEIGSGYRWIVFDAPEMAAALAPGQFVHVRVPGLEPTALRRPFSVFDADAGRVTLLYKVVGRGTKLLSGMKVGETLDCLSGLGNGYDASLSGDRPLLIGGGAGVPPLYMLAKKLIADAQKIYNSAGNDTAKLQNALSIVDEALALVSDNHDEMVQNCQRAI